MPVRRWSAANRRWLSTGRGAVPDGSTIEILNIRCSKSWDPMLVETSAIHGAAVVEVESGPSRVSGTDETMQREEAPKTKNGTHDSTLHGLKSQNPSVHGEQHATRVSARKANVKANLQDEDGFTRVQHKKWRPKSKPAEAGPSNSKGGEGGKLKGKVEVSKSGVDGSKSTSQDAEVMVDVSEHQHPQVSKPFVASEKVQENNYDKMKDPKDKGVEPTNGPPPLVASVVHALRVYNKPRRGPPITTPRSENRFNTLSSVESSEADHEEDLSQVSVQHIRDGPIPVVGNIVGSPNYCT
ncbi:hypothetical protein L6452_34960 [Arctium lappa]|uniref:Uncharacterized protein n=1 Tax=Arctium lappa TaxID=4217 RepID=A0ACB8YK72_ARCLA|nr:hypothetical protein L6452_34960 [Arctium lappa]